MYLTVVGHSICFELRFLNCLLWLASMVCWKTFSNKPLFISNELIILNNMPKLELKSCFFYTYIFTLIHAESNYKKLGLLGTIVIFSLNKN